MSNFIVWLHSPKPNRMSEPELWSRMQSMVVYLPWWCDSVAGARGKRHMFQRHSNVCLTNQKSCSASKWFLSSQELWSRSTALGSSLPLALQQKGGTRLEVGVPWRSNIFTPGSSRARPAHTHTGWQFRSQLVWPSPIPAYIVPLQTGQYAAVSKRVGQAWRSSAGPPVVKNLSKVIELIWIFVGGSLLPSEDLQRYLWPMRISIVVS